MSTESRYHHGDLRSQTLAAARSMLATRSAHELSLREVAKEAGVSHAAPYRHFPDRKDFLVALSQLCRAEFVAAQEQAAAAAPDPRTALVRRGLAYVGYAADHPHAFALINDPMVNPPGQESGPDADLIARSARGLAETADAARDWLPGAGGPDVVTGLWALVHGLAHLVTTGHLDRDRVAAVLDAALLPATR